MLGSKSKTLDNLSDLLNGNVAIRNYFDMLLSYEICRVWRCGGVIGDIIKAIACELIIIQQYLYHH